MFYKTHSSRELRMQSHTTNSIASLTTSPQYVFSLPLIPCSTEVSRASPSTVFSINRATRFSWKKVHKEKSFFSPFSFPCFSQLQGFDAPGRLAFPRLENIYVVAKNREQTLPSSFLSPQAKGWVKIGKIFFIRK